MLSAALPLVAVPLAWYVLGLLGAAVHPRRVSRIDAPAVARGAAIVVLATWVGTRAIGLSGRASLLVLVLALFGAIVARAKAGCLRTSVVPTRRDLPMLLLGTAVLAVWAAPITRHGFGAIGTGNHADLPSYLLQAVYLFDHGLQATGDFPGIEPEARMFDAFGASALLSPTTAVSAVPTIGVMITMMVGAVLLAQFVERLSSRALGGRRVASLAIGGVLLLSWVFTFNSFAYFLAQVWGLAIGVALLMVLADGERGVPAVVSAALLSVAGVLTYNPTGAIYGATALVLGGWWVARDRHTGRPLRASAGAAAIAGIGLGGLVFMSVWGTALDRLWALRDAVAGWPVPTAPLWAALGLPSAAEGNSTRVILAGSAAIGLAAAAGWFATRRSRRLAVRFWPLAIPAVFWVAQAVREPDTYTQWKAFSYAQPVLLVGLGCGLLLLVERQVRRIPLSHPATPAVLATSLAGAMLVTAAIHAFWPRDFFSQSGCCIATGAQIAQIQAAADASPGPVRVGTGSVWASDVAGAVVALSRPMIVDPPSIWPSRLETPTASTITFETGSHPSLVQGRFLSTVTATSPLGTASASALDSR